MYKNHILDVWIPHSTIEYVMSPNKIRLSSVVPLVLVHKHQLNHHVCKYGIKNINTLITFKVEKDRENKRTSL